MAVLPLTVQLIGNANNTLAEVELNNLALRGVIRPGNYALVGQYAFSTGQELGLWGTGGGAGNFSGQYWLRAAANGTLFNRIYLIKKISLQVTNTVAFSTSGAFRVDTFFSRYATAGPGSAAGVKLRTSMAGSTFGVGLSIINVGGATTPLNNASLVDTNPISSVWIAVTATTVRQTFNADLFDFKAGEHPIVLRSLAQLDSINTNLTTVATTNLYSTTTQCDVNVNMTWDEYEFYSSYGETTDPFALDFAA